MNQSFSMRGGPPSPSMRESLSRLAPPSPRQHLSSLIARVRSPSPSSGLQRHPSLQQQQMTMMMQQQGHQGQQDGGNYNNNNTSNSVLNDDVFASHKKRLEAQYAQLQSYERACVGAVRALEGAVSAASAAAAAGSALFQHPTVPRALREAAASAEVPLHRLASLSGGSLAPRLSAVLGSAETASVAGGGDINLPALMETMAAVTGAGGRGRGHGGGHGYEAAAAAAEGAMFTQAEALLQSCVVDQCRARQRQLFIALEAAGRRAEASEKLRKYAKKPEKLAHWAMLLRAADGEFQAALAAADDDHGDAGGAGAGGGSHAELLGSAHAHLLALQVVCAGLLWVSARDSLVAMTGGTHDMSSNSVDGRFSVGYEGSRAGGDLAMGSRRTLTDKPGRDANGYSHNNNTNSNMNSMSMMPMNDSRTFAREGSRGFGGGAGNNINNNNNNNNNYNNSNNGGAGGGGGSPGRHQNPMSGIDPNQMVATPPRGQTEGGGNGFQRTNSMSAMNRMQGGNNNNNNNNNIGNYNNYNNMNSGNFNNTAMLSQQQLQGNEMRQFEDAGYTNGMNGMNNMNNNNNNNNNNNIDGDGGNSLVPYGYQRPPSSSSASPNRNMMNNGGGGNNYNYNNSNNNNINNNNENMNGMGNNMMLTPYRR